MNIFFTGGTGFIGTRLVKKIIQNQPNLQRCYLLVLSSALEHDRARFSDLLSDPETAEKLVFVEGDLREPNLGLSDSLLAELTGDVDHFFHLGAIYDLKASKEVQLAVNEQGTRYAVELAKRIDAKTFHLMSSIAAAGLYPGVFREDMFSEAVGLDHPYFSTKHESERILREDYDIPFRIYRPSFVVGDSETGEMDKVDGPYYLFKSLKSIRQTMPPWMPLLGVEGGRFNVVPVDFVVKAIAHLAFVPDQDGQTFHLTDRQHWKFGELLNLFARAAHAPEFEMRINARLFQFLPPILRNGVMSAPGVSEIVDELLESVGIPKAFFSFLNWPTKYDNRKAEALLEEAGIFVPSLEDYAPTLWDYWERHLDPDLFREENLEERLKDKVVLITGGSSGIGKATALRLSKAGATVVICGRDAAKLETAHKGIEATGGKVVSFRADITEKDDVEALFEMIEYEFSGLDFLINNAGHSIRRSVMQSLDRLHDFERTIDLNYLASVAVTLKSLPLMERMHEGHVINISSIGVLSNSPRFSAYVASKAALEAFSRCAAAEMADHKIYFTNINMPLVRTPMIAPTALYDHVPTLTPDDAADLVAEAILKRPERLSTKLGKFADLVHALSPKLQRQILNTAFRLFPESRPEDTESGERKSPAAPSPAQLLFATLMKGVHW
jgi:NAD(P)-dependent dehydrogenase (short-subunit alcohol dehydrogenase family)/thioester reductase-like protein